MDDGSLTGTTNFINLPASIQFAAMVIVKKSCFIFAIFALTGFGCATASRDRNSSVKSLYDLPVIRFANLESKGTTNTEHRKLSFRSTTGIYFHGFARLSNLRQLRYLTLEDAQQIDPGPAPDQTSARVKAEIEFLLAAQSLRDAETQKRILHESPYQNIHFGPTRISLLDPKMPAQLSPIEKLASVTIRECVIIALFYKAKYDRVRPSFLAKDLQPSIEVPLHPAYPSGHATQSFCLANLLTELFPDQASDLAQTAKEISVNREIAGVHYPSDTEAGQIIAQKIWQRLRLKPNFKGLIDQAKTEVTSGRFPDHIHVYMELDLLKN